MDLRSTLSKQYISEALIALLQVKEYNKISIVFLELLKKLEYIASVFVSLDGVTFSNTPNGFQYIAD